MSSCVLKGAVLLHSAAVGGTCAMLPTPRQRGKQPRTPAAQGNFRPFPHSNGHFDFSPQPNISSYSKARAMRARGQDVPPPSSRSKSEQQTPGHTL